jgi:hypothetical protein
MWPALLEMLNGVCESWSPFYGFVVTTNAASDDAGLVYESFDIRCSTATIREQLDAARWRSLGDARRTKLRGVYWGQILTADKLDMLGGFTALHSELRSLKAIDGSSSEELLSLMPNGSAFLRLTHHPLNDSKYGLRASSDLIGLWFERKARLVGLLD